MLRVIGGARACFKSLLAVGEDPIHLAIRVEYCLGGKVCGPSLRIRQLHNKFSVANLGFVKFWQPEDLLQNHDIANCASKRFPDTERMGIFLQTSF